MQYLKFYLFYIPVLAIITYLVIKFLNNKTNKKRWQFLIVLSVITIVMHLIKPFFPPYNGLGIEGEPAIFSKPSIYRKITIENISAFTAIFMLPALLIKNKYLLDYLSIFGFLGGILAIIWPAEVILQSFDSISVSYQSKLFDFDTIRFYVVHYLAFLITFILLYYRIHTFDRKRAKFFPVTIFFVFSFLLLNEFIVYKLGWLNEVEDYAQTNGLLEGETLFLDQNIRNFSFIFGIPNSFKNAAFFMDILVPSFMKDPYIPVLWAVVPVFVYGPLLYRAFDGLFAKWTFKVPKLIEDSKLEYAQ